MKEIELYDLDEEMLAKFGVDPAIVKVLRDIAAGKGGRIHAHRYMKDAAERNENVEEIAEIFARLADEDFVNVKQDGTDDAELSLSKRGMEFLRSLRG